MDTEKYSIDYIVGFINRKEPLPNQFAKAMSNLVNITFNRGLYSLAFTDLLSLLMIKIDDTDITLSECIKTHTLYKLVSILHRHKLYMIPMSVPNNLPLACTVHLMKAPDLTQDPDIAAIQELKRKGSSNVNYTKNQLATLQNTIVKINNFNVLSRVFEGLGAMQTRPLDVNQRSTLSNILNEKILPHEGNRYIRSLFSYVCDYGSYTYDYNNKLYVLPEISKDLKEELIDILAQVLAPSLSQLVVRDDYIYAKELQAAYEKYRPKAFTIDTPKDIPIPQHKVPVSLRPISELSFKQKTRRLVSSLKSFRASFTDKMLADHLAVRQGFAPEFIELLTSIEVRNKDFHTFFSELQLNLAGDTATRLMLPDLTKCKLYIEVHNIQHILDQHQLQSFVVQSSPFGQKKPTSTAEKASINDDNNDQARSNADYYTTMDRSALDIFPSKASSIDFDALYDISSLNLASYINSYSYTTFNQALRNGETFNAISYTWDKLTHFYYSQLIYSEGQDVKNPDINKDYGANLDQFLKYPLKQISGRLNQTNVFEFILKPMFCGQVTHAQEQFFDTQINNIYLLNNANPIPYLFFHSLYLFDKYLMQPKHHFNNEIFYLSLLAKEPYAINIYLTRVFNKYGNRLINIPKDFYVLIVLQLLLFPQVGLETECYDICRWLFRANFSTVQFTKVVVLHTLAHNFYQLIHSCGDFQDLKMIFVPDAIAREAVYQPLSVSNKPNRPVLNKIIFKPSVLFSEEDIKDSAKYNLGFGNYDDHIFDSKKGSRKKGTGDSKKDALAQGVPVHCHHHINKIFINNIDGQYDKNSPFNENLSKDLMDNYVIPILKRVVSSDHKSMYMFDQLLTKARPILEETNQLIQNKAIPDTTLETLQSNRFIIDTLVLKNDRRELLGLQAVALNARKASDIGFIHGIKTKRIDEINAILLQNLKMMLVPSYYIFPYGDNYSKLRPVIRNIQIIPVPKIFLTPELYRCYKDVLFSLQCAGEVLEIVRGLLSTIAKPRELIESLVKEVVTLHNLSQFEDVVSFVYNYINISYKLIEKEGRLDIDKICESRVRLDQVLIGSNSYKRLYKMLALAIEHCVQNNKISGVFRKRLAKVLLKINVRESLAIMELIEKLQLQSEMRETEAEVVAPALPPTPTVKPIEFDMDKIRAKIKESSEVQSFISTMRENEALREANEQAQKEQELKKRRQMEAAAAAGDSPTTIQDSMAQAEDVSTATEIVPAPSKIKYNELNAQDIATLPEDIQQQIRDLAPTVMQMNAKARNVVEAVALQNVEILDFQEFRGMCLSQRYFSVDAAIEEINELCREEYEDILFDLDLEQELVYLTMEILSQLTQECHKLKEIIESYNQDVDATVERNNLLAQLVSYAEFNTKDFPNLPEEIQQKISNVAPIGKIFNAKARNVIEAVAALNLETVDFSELKAICLEQKYFSVDAAIEEINEICQDEYDDILFDIDEEAGQVYITLDLLNKLTKECRNLKHILELTYKEDDSPANIQDQVTDAQASLAIAADHNKISYDDFNIKDFSSLPELVQQQISNVAPIGKSMNAKARHVIEAVAVQDIEVMDFQEFKGICLAQKYFSVDAALEEINETCQDEYEDILFDLDEGEGKVYITLELLNQLSQECRNLREILESV